MFDGLRKRLRDRKKPDKVEAVFVRHGASINHELFPPDDTNQLLQHVVGDVYACVSLSAQSVAEAAVPELFVKKKSGRKCIHPTCEPSARQKAHLKRHTPYMTEVENAELVLEHPILDLLKTINPLWDRFDFFEAWSLHVDVARFFAYIVKNELGVPVELWPLPPGPMRPVMSKDGLISHWLYGFFPKQVRFETNEILYHRPIGPMRTEVDAILGFPALRGGFAGADASLRLRNHLSNLLANRAVPDLLITVKGASDPKLERIRNVVSDWGGANIGRNAVVGEEVDVKQLGWNPKDIQYNDAANGLREHIANIFHVPISVLTADAVGRANAEAGIYMMAKGNTSPRLMRIQEKLNQQLMPLFEPSGDMFLTFPDPIPEDKEFAVDENERYVNAGIITPNEARVSIGRDSHPDPEADKLRSQQKPQLAPSASNEGK